MFADRYFADRYFPRRYFPKGGGAVVVPDPVTTGADTFPIPMVGGLTLPAGVTGLKVLAFRWAGQPRTIDITGISFDGDADTGGRAYTRGIPTEEILCSGIVMGTKAGLAFRSTLSLLDDVDEAIELVPHSWVISKSWPLRLIAGRRFSASAQDSRSKWTHGTAQHSLSFSATPRNDGPGLTREQMYMSLAADSIGTLAFAGAIHADSWDESSRKLSARWPRTTFSGRAEGPITYTVGTSANSFAWLLNVNTPPRGAVVMDTGGGETVECDAILHSLTLRFSKTYGGAITFDARLRVDSEET